MRIIIKFFIFVGIVCSLNTWTATVQAVIPTKNIKPLYVINTAANQALSKPTDIAVNSDYIYVVDGDNSRIVVYNKKGQYVRQIGRFGRGKGEFNYPVGIGLDGDGNIYVADTKNHRVQIFNVDGSFERIIQTESGGEPVRPVDVSVSNDNSKIYVTTKVNNILVYKKNGKKIKEVGKTGKDKGEFRFPATIANLSEGRYGVVDVQNFRLQIFSAKDHFSYQVGDFGVRPGLFIRPKGVAVSPDNKIYISDSYMDVIEVFSNKGRFLHVLGAGGKPHRVTAPGGIAIDKQNRLYVCEVYANRISVFQLE